MKIEFLGVGSGLSPELGNNNALLTSENSNKTLLIDCGFSTPPVLTQRERGLQSITDILITHLHSDHVGGLELMGFTFFYVYKNFPNFEPITLHLPSKEMENDIWEMLPQMIDNWPFIKKKFTEYLVKMENLFSTCEIRESLECNFSRFSPFCCQLCFICPDKCKTCC